MDLAETPAAREASEWHFLFPHAASLRWCPGEGKVGTPICFDCDYEGVVRKMTAAGAECFLVPLMDAESWTARQHDQHAELFRIRACENGRWMFTCGTSGVSQLIDANGHVHNRLAAMEQGVLSGRLVREVGLTIYTRFGWLFPWGVLGVAAACWVFLMIRKKAVLGVVLVAASNGDEKFEAWPICDSVRLTHTDPMTRVPDTAGKDR
jgi:predicted amidohydrolase